MMKKITKIVGVSLYGAASLIQFASILLLFIYGPVVGLGSVLMAKNLWHMENFSKKDIIKHVGLISLSVSISVWILFNFKM